MEEPAEKENRSGDTGPAERMGRVVALDGLRGVAVLMVVFGHTYETLNIRTRGISTLTSFLHDADLGVLIFFVLSGYLITGILVRDQQVGAPSLLRRFYMRRILRIWPAFFFYVAVVASLIAIGVLHVPRMSFAAASLFFADYHPMSGWWLSHTWSLAVEEQFYLVWPFALLLLRPRRLFTVALAGVVLAPLIRVAIYVFVPSGIERLTYSLHGRSDSLLVGAALALLPTQAPSLARSLMALARRPRVYWSCAAYLFVAGPVIASRLLSPFESTVGWTASSVAAGVLILILADCTVETDPMRHMFEDKRLVWLGAISFSLYLWQQLFLTPLNTTPLGWPGIGILAAIGCAWMSRRFVEEPFLRLKHLYAATSVPVGEGEPRPMPG